VIALIHPKDETRLRTPGGENFFFPTKKAGDIGGKGRKRICRLGRIGFRTQKKCEAGLVGKDQAPAGRLWGAVVGASVCLFRAILSDNTEREKRCGREKGKDANSQWAGLSKGRKLPYPTSGQVLFGVIKSFLPSSKRGGKRKNKVRNILVTSWGAKTRNLACLARSFEGGSCNKREGKAEDWEVLHEGVIKNKPSFGN